MPAPTVRPPFATDEPDTYYETPNHPQRRQRQPKQPDPNDRTSNYDVYNDYFDDDDKDKPANRQSGMGALGGAFLNGSIDDDSDDDDSNRPRKSNENPFASKHDALAAATKPQGRGPPSPTHAPEPTPAPVPAQPIAAPRPGYAAPIAALNLAKPEPAMAPSVQRRPTLDSQGPALAPSDPFNQPVSPITPAFARPRPPKQTEVTFAEKNIMRGDNEETMLPRRGDAGDDFWRRFSMVVKQSSNEPKQSTWLKRTESGKNRLATWVWVVGLIIVLLIGGSIGIGWYASRKKPDHQQPTAFGGGAELAAPSSVVQVVGSGKGTSRSSLVVTPTHTVQRRYVPRAQVTPAAHPEHRRGATLWQH